MNTLALLSFILVAGVGVASATRYDFANVQKIFQAENLPIPEKELTSEDSSKADGFSAAHFASRTQSESTQTVEVPPVVLYSFTYELNEGELFEVYNRSKYTTPQSKDLLYYYDEPTFEEEGRFPDFKEKADNGLTSYLQSLRKDSEFNLKLETAQVNATLVKISHKEPGNVKFYARMQISGRISAQK